MERLRDFDSANEVLRLLMLHVGCGSSLRATAGGTKEAGTAEISYVTSLNRLRQTEGWLQHRCLRLLKEGGVRWQTPKPRPRVRAVDGTVIKQPGPSGSQRLPVTPPLQPLLPELSCDYMAITATEGLDTAEHLGCLPAAPEILPWRIGATATRPAFALMAETITEPFMGVSSTLSISRSRAPRRFRS
jgi:hypothetical protein